MTQAVGAAAVLSLLVHRPERRTMRRAAIGASRGALASRPRHRDSERRRHYPMLLTNFGACAIPFASQVPSALAQNTLAAPAFAVTPAPSNPQSGSPMVSPLGDEPDALAPQSTKPSSNGLLGPIRFGPMIGGGLPNLINFGVLVKVTHYFGLGANIGLIPTLRISYYGDAKLSFREYDVFGRLHPFGGGFFLGTGIGYASLRATVIGTFDTSPYADQVPPNIAIPSTLTYASRGSMRTLVLTPQLGYCHVAEVGFTFCADIGAQVPIAPSKIEFQSQIELPPDTPSQVTSAVRAELVDANDQKVRDSLGRLGRTPVPALAVRIGWLF